MNNSPEWIRATLLMAQGDRAEAQRWLEAHLNEYPQDAQQLAVQWLRAQVSPSREERLLLLRGLLRTAPASDPYHQLARETLAIEERDVRPAAPQWRKPLVAAGLGGVALLALGWGALNVLSPPAGPTPTVDVVAEVTAEATELPVPTLPAPQPIRVTLPPIRYDAGELTVVAIEDGAVSVVSRASGNLVTPITGAQFFAVSLSFECRIGICAQPPQATLTLVESDGFTFAPREDIRLTGDGGFPPVALGILSEGVVIFEVPVIGVPEQLIITPLNDQERPLMLDLEGVRP